MGTTMAQAKQTGREWTGNDGDQAFDAAGTVFGGNTLLDRLVDEKGVQTKAEIPTTNGGVLTADIKGTDFATTTSNVVEVKGVELDRATASIKVAATTTLKPTITPETATNKAVTFKSDNTAVATVTNAGVVTGVAAGTANITVTTTDQGLTATTKVTVTA